jgi:hypothetical protein
MWKIAAILSLLATPVYAQAQAVSPPPAAQQSEVTPDEKAWLVSKRTEINSALYDTVKKIQFGTDEEAFVALSDLLEKEAENTQYIIFQILGKVVSNNANVSNETVRNMNILIERVNLLYRIQQERTAALSNVKDACTARGYVPGSQMYLDCWRIVVETDSAERQRAVDFVNGVTGRR